MCVGAGDRNADLPPDDPDGNGNRDPDGVVDPDPDRCPNGDPDPNRDGKGDPAVSFLRTAAAGDQAG